MNDLVRVADHRPTVSVSSGLRSQEQPGWQRERELIEHVHLVVGAVALDAEAIEQPRQNFLGSYLRGVVG